LRVWSGVTVLFLIALVFAAEGLPLARGLKDIWKVLAYREELAHLFVQEV